MGKKQRTLIVPEKEYKKLVSLASYHSPMEIAEMVITYDTFWGNEGYYLCPRCKSSLERDFMLFCNCCGQKLDWNKYKEVKRIYPTQNDKTIT